jgi:hypothetical protein
MRSYAWRPSRRTNSFDALPSSRLRHTMYTHSSGTRRSSHSAWPFVGGATEPRGWVGGARLQNCCVARLLIVRGAHRALVAHSADFIRTLPHQHNTTSEAHLGQDEFRVLPASCIIIAYHRNTRALGARDKPSIVSMVVLAAEATRCSYAPRCARWACAQVGSMAAWCAVAAPTT